MKNIILLLSGILLMSFNVQAQTPEKFNYQGIARDTNGAPMATQTLGLQISILNGSSAVYVETHTVTTNNFGLYTLAVGDGTATTGTMGGVDWSTGNKHIKVEIDPNGGTNYTDLGTTELLSVPYAMYAAASGGGGTTGSFFEADTDKISYTETTDFGKDFLMNTEEINYPSGSTDTKYKMMFLPSKEGAFRAGSMNKESWDLTKIGLGSVAFGYNTEASGAYSTALGVNTIATNSYATAMGNKTSATGTNSTAMGSNSSASGTSSTAMGSVTSAIGSNSTAMGIQTRARGDYSTAMGRGTEASGDNSTAIGYSTVASGNTSIAMGDHTAADGIYSTAMGHKTKATGENSTAMGFETEASKENSTAMGESTTASGYASTAMGYFTTSSGRQSTAMGFGTGATGDFSTAMGAGSLASGRSSTAMGFETKASGNTSIAMGQRANAQADYSTVIGQNITLTSSAKGSMFLGDASRTSSVQKGQPNRFYGVFDGGYYLFTNGTLENDYGVGLGHNASSWSTISDRNKKENIKIADGAYFLESIKKMELGSWNYIGQDKKKYRHWGPMAQDMYKYFGEDGIGTIGNDTTIATADIDGVMMIAIQQLANENDALKAALKAQKELTAAQHIELKDQASHYQKTTDELEQRLLKIEALLQRSEPKAKYTKR